MRGRRPSDPNDIADLEHRLVALLRRPPVLSRSLASAEFAVSWQHLASCRVVQDLQSRYPPADVQDPDQP